MRICAVKLFNRNYLKEVKKMTNRKRGQSAIEYLLLAGAIILFVVIVFGVVQTFVYAPSKNQSNQSATTIQGLIDQAGTPTSLMFLTECQTIDASGNYELLNNLTSATTCFTISAENVVIDCKGYSINVTGYPNTFIANLQAGANNGTIKNCEIFFRDRGFEVHSANNSFYNNRACGYSYGGLTFEVYASQKASSGNYCHEQTCWQGTASNVCTPNIAGDSNCTYVC